MLQFDLVKFNNSLLTRIHQLLWKLYCQRCCYFLALSMLTSNLHLPMTILSWVGVYCESKPITSYFRRVLCNLFPLICTHITHITILPCSCLASDFFKEVVLGLFNLSFIMGI